VIPGPAAAASALPIDLVASDLDGTFLGTGGAVSALNAHAVRRAAELGLRVVFATGRPYRWLQPLDAVREADPLVIASNGAVVLDLGTRRVLDTYPLPESATIGVAADLSAALPGLGFAVEYDAGGWGRTPAYPIRGDLVPQDVLAESVEALVSAQAPLKLLVHCPTLPTEELARRAAPIVAGRLSWSFSIVQPDGILELCAPGVDKASTLRGLLTRFGIGAQRVAAFGDMPNDLPLLRLAGHPYVMADAHPSLLGEGFAVAGDHNRSGFGRTLLALLGEPVTATVE